MTTTNVSQLKFNKLSENQYEATTPVDGEFYITPCPTYALDSEAVHKNGDEEINDAKTFTGILKTSNNYPMVEISNTEIEKGTLPTENKYCGLLFEDKNGDGQVPTRLGDIVYSINANGDSKTAFKAWNFSGSGSAGISIIYPSSGNPYATAPTPDIGDKSTKIATTEWCYDPAKSTNLVHRTGDETIGGNKTFSQQPRYSGTTTASSAQDSTALATVGYLNNPNLSLNVVHRTGNETINGVKTFSGASRITYLKSTVIDRTTPPSSGYQYAFIDVIDKNNNRLGVLGSQIGPDGKYGTYLQAGNEANIYVKSDGRNGYFEFPRCTTAATTTSTAANDKVAVVVQNYRSGTSWYRIWSDGWIEQGGRGTFSSQAEEEKTLLKPFSNTDYNLILTNLGHQHNIYGYPKTTSTFLMGMATPGVSWGSGNFSWYACGY